MTLGVSPGQSVVMRVGGPQAPSPPSPGLLSCTRTLYPVLDLRFINVTFSLGSTGVGATACFIQSFPGATLLPSALCSPYTTLPSPPPPLVIVQHPVPPQLSPLTHNGRPGHGAVLGPVVQADRGNGSISRVGDQRGHHKLAALLGQEPRRSQGHRGHCRDTQSKAWPRKLTQCSEAPEDSVFW